MTGRRRAARPIGTIRIEILGTDLPGRQCGPDPDGVWYENVHVGLARRQETVEVFPGDAPGADWVFEVRVGIGEAGDVDFGGPFVLGPRGERYLGLRWLREDADGSYVMFRGAKFRLWELDRAIVESAMQPGRRLVGRLGLTDAQGWPRCATVRPPDIAWSVEGPDSPASDHWAVDPRLSRTRTSAP